MSAHTGDIEKVLAAFRDIGPMTSAELLRVTGLGPNATKLVSILRRKGVKVPKRIRICEWVRVEVGPGDFRVRAVYCIGSGRDVKKPPPLTQYERCIIYRQRKAVALEHKAIPNSVFAFAQAAA